MKTYLRCYTASFHQDYKLNVEKSTQTFNFAFPLLLSTQPTTVFIHQSPTNLNRYFDKKFYNRFTKLSFLYHKTLKIYEKEITSTNKQELKKTKNQIPSEADYVKCSDGESYTRVFLTAHGCMIKKFHYCIQFFEFFTQQKVKKYTQDHVNTVSVLILRVNRQL